MNTRKRFQPSSSVKPTSLQRGTKRLAYQTRSYLLKHLGPMNGAIHQLALIFPKEIVPEIVGFLSMSYCNKCSVWVPVTGCLVCSCRKNKRQFIWYKLQGELVPSRCWPRFSDCFDQEVFDELLRAGLNTVEFRGSKPLTHLLIEIFDKWSSEADKYGTLMCIVK